MNRSSMILAVLSTGLALAQNEPLLRGHASQPGVEISFETRLEPPTPPLAEKFTGGTVTDFRGIHRYMWNDAIQKSFGYDLQVERLPLGYDYRVTFRPLSVHPKVGADVPLPGYPEPQTVHSGATIALDLFVNPATQQKLVEYIHFQEPGQNLPASGHGSRLTQAYVIRPGDTLFLNVLHQRDLSGPLLVSPDGYVSIRFGGMTKAAGLTTQELSSAIARRLATFFTNPQVNVQVLRINQLNGSAPPRDFSLEDAELRIAAPRIRFNGKPLPITDGYKGNVSGRTVWFYLPQSGRYTLSLLPRQIKGFIKAGEVRGGTLTFTIDNEALELNCNNDIVPGNGPYNLYVRHNPAWQPNEASTRGNFLLGSADDPDRTEIVQVSSVIGSKCYISGAVHRPGAYPLTGPKTIYEALIEAGGLNDFAKATKIYVLRGVMKIPFNYKDVRNGKNLGQNIQLRNGDVIVVP